MAGCVIEWATVQVWPDLVPGEQLGPPRFGYGPEATISFTPTHGLTGDYLHADCNIPLTVSCTTCDAGYHHTSSLRSRGGFGYTPDGVVTDPSLHLSHPDQQVQTCVSIGAASGNHGAAPPSSRMLAGNRTSVGPRRIKGFNLRLNLVGLQPGPDRRRTWPSPLSNISLDHPFAAQVYGHNLSATEGSLFFVLDQGIDKPTRPPTPPSRPRAPSPAHRHCHVTDRMRQLAYARTVSSLGLPQVKPARDNPNRSSSAAMSDGRGNSTTNLLRKPIGPGQPRRMLEVKLDCGNCSQPRAKLIF